MPNLAQTLKQEIARIARKEVREDVTALRKAASTYRSEIAALKRSVKDLQVQLRATHRASARAAPVQVHAERLKAKRQALGLSQAQMAALLGISTLSQWKWESGQVTPRASKLARYFEVMAMGKREAAKQLEAA
jgi:DNA-binding transcriptional regulator YiaG